MSIRKVLIADGWNENHTRIKVGEVESFYKQFKTPTRCLTNYNKPGIQVFLSHFNLPFGESEYDAWQISIRGESVLGWVDFNFYSLSSEEIVEKLDQFVEKLLAAWEIINAE